MAGSSLASRFPHKNKCRKKGLMLEQGQQEEDRAEERLINTQGGEQVSQTNVIYRVSIPHTLTGKPIRLILPSHNTHRCTLVKMCALTI